MFDDNDHWLEHLQMLTVRFNYLGLEADMTTLTLIELWWLYLCLSRLAEG